MDTPTPQALEQPITPEKLTEATSPVTTFDVFFLNLRATLCVGLIALPLYLPAFPGNEAFFLPVLILGLLAIVTLSRLLLQVWPAVKRLRYESQVKVHSLGGKWTTQGVLRKPTRAYQTYLRALAKYLETLPLEPNKLLFLAVERAGDEYSFAIKKRLDLAEDETKDMHKG